MSAIIPNSISIHENFDLEAKPDFALIKLHFTGEGMTLEDAAASADKKVAEATEALQSSHKGIEAITVFDIHLGQKEDRLHSETQSFPRPLVVKGVSIVARPDDLVTLHRIIDDGIKRGALLDNPHRRSYMTDVLDSALLFALVDSGAHERLAIEKCLERAAEQSRRVAACGGRRAGKLITLSNVRVEPSMTNPFSRNYEHLQKSFPTKFLSPTPERVLVCASLVATYELLEAGE